MTCNDCIHNGVCHIQEMSTGLEIEEYIREFGCEDYISNTDLVGVVRCKDCKWWYNEIDCRNTSGLYRFVPNGNWFCASGERRDT